MKSKKTTARRTKTTAQKKSSRPAVKTSSGRTVLEGIRRSQERKQKRQRHARSDSQTSALSFPKVRGNGVRTTQSTSRQKKGPTEKRFAKSPKHKTAYEIEQIASSKKAITHGKRRANIAALKSEPHTISQNMRTKQARDLASRRSQSKRKMPPPIRNIRGHDSQKQNSRTSLQNTTD